MLTLKYAQEKRRVFYLVPMKSLAEEKYNQFKKMYQSANIGVVISTRDHHEFDALIETGKFDVAIVVYEKLSALMVRSPRLIEEVALVLKDWISAEVTCEIEKKYLVYAGAIRRVGEEFSWLAESLAALAEVEGWKERDVKKIQSLSQRLILGLTEKGLAISHIRIRGLGRTYINQLIHNGYDTPETLAELPLKELIHWLPESLAQRVYQFFHPVEITSIPVRSFSYPEEEKADFDQREANYTLSRKVAKETPMAGDSSETTGGKPVLVIDCKKLEVTFMGENVVLPPLSFQLLYCLAEKPGEYMTRTELYQKLYSNDKDAIVSPQPYEHQISDHKRKIIDKIRKTFKRNGKINMTVIKNLILTRPRVGYMLNLECNEIEIIKR